MSAARFGGIVLCGGKSSRMGRPKASLPFGSELMLPRVVRLVREVVQPIVVVAASDQELPGLPDTVLLARDECSERGPLEGLRAGLAALAPHADAAFATSCDVPLLQPPFIRRLLELLDDYEIVVPRDGKYHHPLAAVYRVTVLDRVTELLAADRLRPVYLFEKARTCEVDVERLREVDPQLQSLRNLNHPEDYAAALAEAGLGPPI